MPTIETEVSDLSEDQSSVPTELPFPPVTKQHILNCSYNVWHPKYRTITPKARLIPLSEAFLDYLRADGIILPSDYENGSETSDNDSGIFSASESADVQDDSDNEQEDVAANWRNTHNAIKRTIADLGGKVMPKLNWSAPKDATWMNANSMECRTPQDIYLLLKSSDFITYDLEYAFDDTVDSPDSVLTADDIPYHLVLRKSVTQWNPSVEFRCFVRNRRLLCMCQRDLNHFDFLSNMSTRLRSLIQELFDVRLRDTFQDASFVFDVYVPPPHNRVWLVDVNPWAPRTDPLLFSWLEILTMPEPPDMSKNEEEGIDFVRLSLKSAPGEAKDGIPNGDVNDGTMSNGNDSDSDTSTLNNDDDDSDVEDIWLPELRLVHRNDPEAFSFNSPQYSAHKLPKDVVDASQSGEGLREFARDWQNVLSRRQRQDAEYESSDEG